MDIQERRDRQVLNEASRGFLCKSLNMRIKDIPLRRSGVYVLALSRDPLLYKIGHTTQPRTRIKAISWRHKSTICKYFLTCELTKPQEIEQHLHQVFRKRQERFNNEVEWHRLLDEDLQTIVRYFSAIARGEEF